MSATTARARIVAALLGIVLTTVALIVLVTWTFLTVRDNERIDADLEATGLELNALATGFADPATGRPFTSAGALLRAAVDRAVPGQDEVRMAIVDGEVVSRTTHGSDVPLEQASALISAATAATEPQRGTARTQFGSVRYLVVPVIDESGTNAFVAAILRDVSADQVRQITAVVAGVGFMGVLLAAVVGWVVAGRVLAPLDRLRTAAADITARELDTRITEDGPRDVRALTRSFNAMLDRLSSSFAAQRRLTADAGHELRTPLTVLRGHVELLSDNPDIRADQRRVVLEEIDRMSAMVDELVELARLDRAPTIASEDLEPASVLNRWRDLAAGMPPRTWTWIPLGDIVNADPMRLNQVFLILAQNAISATNDDDPMEAGLAVTETGAVAWVADSGPGIPPAEREAILRPFARGTHRAPGGSGLGLAIANQIARAHGGRLVILDSRPIQAEAAELGGACVAMTWPGNPSTLRPADGGTGSDPPARDRHQTGKPKGEGARAADTHH